MGDTEVYSDLCISDVRDSRSCLEQSLNKLQNPAFQILLIHGFLPTAREDKPAPSSESVRGTLLYFREGLRFTRRDANKRDIGIWKGVMKQCYSNSKV